MKKFCLAICLSIKEGASQIWRHRFLSATALILSTLILLWFDAMVTVRFWMQHSLQQLENRADFVIPLRADFDVFELSSLRNNLSNNFNITDEIIAPITEDNLSVPASYRLIFHDLHQVADIFAVLQISRYDEVIGNWDRSLELEFITVVSKLLHWKNALAQLSYWLSLLFVIGGVLLMVNTFQLSLFARRQEIFISKIVGGDYSYIIKPLIVEGLLLGALSGLLSVIIYTIILKYLPGISAGDIFLYLWRHVFGLQIIGAAIVGAVGAWWAASKYLAGQMPR